MAEQTIVDKLDALIEQKHLLKHPFYQAWNAGTLTRKTLQEYACQYYKHVDAFPRYISAVHSNCNDISVRQELLENLIEEEKGEENHPELWMRFASSLDVSRDEVIATNAYPETKHLVDTFMHLSKDTSVIEGIAALYAYEAQIPEVSTTKIDGLKKFYGVNDHHGLSFFVVHQEADTVHRQVGRDLLAQLIKTPEDEAKAMKAVDTSLDALWNMLSGVQTRAMMN